MSTFTELKIGRVPITEEGVDRYQINDSILSHFSELSSLEDLNVSVGRIWTEMKVPLPWLQICTANYIHGTITFNNPAASSLEVRGWIDSVEPVSDTEDFPVCRVKWHFDYWEMYKNTAVFNYGHVKRRPYRGMDSTPIQDYPMRFTKRGDRDIDLLTGNNGWEDVMWVIVVYNDSWSVEGYTSIVPIAFPVTKANGMSVVIRHTGRDLGTLNMQEIFRGLLDERYGIPGSAIIGAWLSPACPFPSGYNVVSSGSGTSADPYVLSGVMTVQQYKRGGHNAGADDPYVYYGLGLNGLTGPIVGDHLVTFGGRLMSTETERFIVTSTDGTKMLELPYGYGVDRCSVRSFINSNEAFIQISFADDSDTGSLQNTVGLCVNIPLPGLPINTNAWSDYVYSGQRDYDKDARVLQSQSNAFKGAIAGAGTGAAYGAFSGIGAAVGAAAGATGAIASYGVEMLFTNDKEQELSDRLMANQLSSLILSSGAVQPFFDKLGIHLRTLVPDPYSLDVIGSMRDNNGVSVDEILGSCDSLVRQESPRGFYQIPNLIISGPLPVEAKDTIKQKFSAGVRLI